SRLHGLRMALIGLYLARRLTQVEIPDSIVRLVQADPEVEAIAAQIIKDMFIVPDQYETVNPEAIALRAMDRRSDRLRYWLYRAITPTMGDWTFLPLPIPLYPAYFIIRPLRFALMPLRRALAARAGTKV